MATSGITFSGFNDIDFNVVLNAIMDQESVPLTILKNRQTELQKTDSNYALLATKLSTLESASAALSSTRSFITYAATTSDSAALSVSASSSAVAGRYEVVVEELARSQTSVSSSFTADTDTTIVATGGSLTIGGQAIAVSGPVTLRGLVDLINANADSPASASVVQTEPGKYRLVLSGKETGAANAFAIQSNLIDPAIAFNGPPTVEARNASVSINGIDVQSTTNTLTDAIPGTTVTLHQKDVNKTVVVTVGRDDDDLAGRVQTFVTAYNDLVKFAADQQTAASRGTLGTLGRDPLLRSLRDQVRDVLAAAHGSAAFRHLAEVGIEFNRTGQLTFDRSDFQNALTANADAVRSLFTDGSTGVFDEVEALVQEYTDAGGFVPDARTRLTEELRRVGRRSDDLTERLAVRRRALQAQFIAADQAMSRLKSQQGALASFGSSIND